MDIIALVNDLETLLKLLPPDLVRNVMGSIIQHLPTLGAVWPQIVALMKPHLMAGMVANASGSLDEEALTKEVMALFQRYFAANPPQG